MPAWNEPGTRAVGARILAEERSLHEGMTDPHGDAFERALDVALTPGAGVLSEAKAMRARGARGQSAIAQDVAEYKAELGRRGKTMRTVMHEAHRKAKAKAQGGEGRTDEFDPLAEETEVFLDGEEPEREAFSLYPPDDGYEPEEDSGGEEADEYAHLPERIARYLRDDEEEPTAPEFTVPQLPTGDPYSALEGSLGYLDASQLGELAVAVQNDPSLTAARRFELSERIGRVVAAR